MWPQMPDTAKYSASVTPASRATAREPPRSAPDGAITLAFLASARTTFTVSADIDAYVRRHADAMNISLPHTELCSQTE